jgi:hypothetical protein
MPGKEPDGMLRQPPLFAKPGGLAGPPGGPFHWLTPWRNVWDITATDPGNLLAENDLVIIQLEFHNGQDRRLLRGIRQRQGQ